MTLDAFGKLAVSSGLLTVEREAALRAEARPHSVLAYINYLVAAGVLTEWQCEKLWSGKHKGFFQDHYKLLSYLEQRPEYSRYLAEDTNTGRRAVLRFFHGFSLRIRYAVEPPDDATAISN